METETHDVLSDEAVSFVRRAPGRLHRPVLAIITGQLQVPGGVGHCRTHTHLKVGVVKSLKMRSTFIYRIFNPHFSGKHGMIN